MRKQIINQTGFWFLCFCSTIILISLGCSQKPKLKEVFRDDFYIGAALTGNQILGKDTRAIRIVKDQFNSITSENAMKWDTIHPKPNEYNFLSADSFVAFGERNHMFIIGHTLIWHQQIPKWVFEDGSGKLAGRDTLLKRMHDHIFTIMSRYKGRVNGWDVINEAIDENGELRKTKWLEIIGGDYIQKAFEYAREADPKAELYYNDYNIEKSVKREGTIFKILQNVQSKGVKVDGVGIQAHWHLDTPDIKLVDSSIQAFSKFGVKVMFTEMDINVLPRPENLEGAEISQSFKLTKKSNPYPEILPDLVQEKLANRYADFFKLFIKYKGIVSRVTFWGIYDSQSWLNNWPIKGRTNYPLIFDRNYQPKPAFFAIIKTAGFGK